MFASISSRHIHGIFAGEQLGWWSWRSNEVVVQNGTNGPFWEAERGGGRPAK
jgi:hypothetical protein